LAGKIAVVSGVVAGIGLGIAALRRIAPRSFDAIC
jgi:hypothetical protein